MNTRKTVLAALFAAAFVAPLAVAPVQAQTEQQAPLYHYYSQAELDQMLAPIALYPDGLLSQVLMAATYPSEVAASAAPGAAAGTAAGLATAPPAGARTTP